MFHFFVSVIVGHFSFFFCRYSPNMKNIGSLYWRTSLLAWQGYHQVKGISGITGRLLVDIFGSNIAYLTGFVKNHK